MDIKVLIESIGLSPAELKPYLLGEIDEFIDATGSDAQEEELNDVVFALRSLSYARIGKHIPIDDSRSQEKLKNRLREFGTISKKDPVFLNIAIKEIPIGVVHFSFGNFKQPWTNFDPVKNGTEAEIVMLTDDEYLEHNHWANHLIVTFDDVDQLEYSFLTSGWSRNEKNTILCRVPDFLFKHAKQSGQLLTADDGIASQIEAALQHVTIKKDTIFHFHSWESGIALSSPNIKKLIAGKRKIFSPYLTVSRFKEIAAQHADSESTLNAYELRTGVEYESRLISFCDLIVVESKKDEDFYKKLPGAQNKVRAFSYSREKQYDVKPDSLSKQKLCFVTGGRPVFEKGFIELCREIPSIIDFAKNNNLEIHFRILCGEYDRATKEPKKTAYIKALHDTISELKLDDYVSVEDKVSIDELRNILSQSSALIVPSLYDPYCLMPHYAIDEHKVSFVSCFAGISENILSTDYVFDPTKPGSLLKSIKKWYEGNVPFVLSNANTSYKTLYLN
ncbi:MAG TPA: hypothetical protein VMF88_10505 [Bacteroidota bacterium]|nr:hypothetical protein [Bacteroidota bacterium]